MRLTGQEPRHPHTNLPDGFHGFPAGVCPWCTPGGEGAPSAQWVRHGGPCPVWRVHLNGAGGIERLEQIGPPFKRLGDL